MARVLKPGRPYPTGLRIGREVECHTCGQVWVVERDDPFVQDGASIHLQCGNCGAIGALSLHPGEVEIR